MIVYLDTCCLCRPYDDLTKIRNKIESESVLFSLRDSEWRCNACYLCNTWEGRCFPFNG